MKFLKNIRKARIKQLKKEHDYIKNYRDIWYEKGMLGYDRLTLILAVKEFKVTLWECF